MKIKIRMISGTEYIFYNNKYKNIEDWIENNFKSTTPFTWFGITKESPIRLKFNNIEAIEEVVDSQSN